MEAELQHRRCSIRLAEGMLRREDRRQEHEGALFRAAVTIFCASCSAASSLLIPSCATDT